MRGEDWAFAEKIADKTLDSVGMEGKYKNLPAELSGGEQQRVAVARAIAGKPKILFADEPTANLDVHSTELIRDLMHNVDKAGTTVLLTTHNMPEVEQVCDRVAIINHGKLIDLDTPTGFKSRHTEKIVDVVLEEDNKHRRININLASDTERDEFANLLQTSIPVTIHTREFDFGEVFMKLTGEAYN